MDLHYRMQGSGVPLIVLHGLFGSMDNWRSVASRLAHRFQVISVDLPNHGRSPHEAVLTYPALARDLIRFMDGHGISQAALLGHSLGGKVAMQCALDFPRRVNRLIVADMAPRTYPPEHIPIFKALMALDVSAYESRREMDDALAGSLPNASVRQFLLMNLEKAAAGYRWRINLDNLYRNYPAICAGITGESPYSGPSLFIKGGQSNYIREGDEPEIKRWFPKADIRTMADAGHWLHVEAPEIFIDIVTAFLSEKSGQRL